MPDSSLSSCLSRPSQFGRLSSLGLSFRCCATQGDECGVAERSNLLEGEVARQPDPSEELTTTPQHCRKHHEAQLIYEIVVQEIPDNAPAPDDEDSAITLLDQVLDGVNQVTREDGGVIPSRS